MKCIEYSKLDDDMLLATEQVADWFQVSASYLNKARMTGTGPTFRPIGRAVRYRVGDCRAWLDSTKRNRTRMGYALFWDDNAELTPEEIQEALL
jgi:predicted DNA-binding transcriptional regulator AlpA